MSVLIGQRTKKCTVAENSKYKITNSVNSVQSPMRSHLLKVTPYLKVSSSGQTNFFCFKIFILDFDEMKVPICEAETSKHSSSLTEKLALRQSLGSAPQAWPKVEEQPFIKGSVGMFDLPPSERKSNYHVSPGGLGFKQVSTIQMNNKIIQR